MSNDSAAPAKRRNWSILIFVLVVVAIGGVVGRRAGDLAHRAPRSTATRVAVIPPELKLGADVEAKGLDLVIARAFEDALTQVPALGVVPLEVVRGRFALMKKGGHEGGLEEAARILEVDRVVTGAVEVADGGALRLTLAVHAPGTPASGGDTMVVPIRGDDPMQELLAGIPSLAAKITGSLPPTPAKTMDIKAFALDVQGRERVAEARMADAVPLFLEADAPIARAHAVIAVALTRDAAPSDQQVLAQNLVALAAPDVALPPKEKLLVDGIREMQTFLQGNPASEVGERAFAAFRAVTVQYPEEPLGHLFLGKSYTMLMKAPDEALHHLENARRLVPQWLPATEEIVAAWLAKGNRKQATAELKSYMVLAPDDELAKKLLSAVDDSPRFQ